jgi:hypothetical protein
MIRQKPLPYTILILLALFLVPTLACSLPSVTNLLADATPTAAPTLVTVPSPVPQLTVIVNGVMARDATSDTFDPTGITDAFGPEQKSFHAIITIKSAPANTTFKAVWTAVDIGTLLAPNSKIGEYELQSDGSRNLDFTFAPDAGRLPPGKYKVDIFVNGSLDRTLNFSVTGTAQVQPTPPAAPTTVPPTAAAVAKPSGLIKSVTMASDVKADTKDPVNPTTEFKPAATFHAVVAIDKAPANTKFKSVWYATDVGNAAPANTLIDQTEVIADSNTRNIDFSLTPSSQWPVGKFRVEILVNGTLDRVVNFTVK